MLRQKPGSPDHAGSLVAVIVAFGLLSLPVTAYAVLGEAEGSVSSLAKTWKSARMLSLTEQKFRVLEVDDGGVSVREYIGADGRVFAVTWRGLRQPNLTQLLGTYHSELKAAEKQRPLRRALREPLELKTLNTTSYRGGHMRDVRGRVFLTDQLPDGVRPEDLE